MNNDATGDFPDALRPLASLISKSEKALPRVPPGSWQHTMLRSQLNALHLAATVIKTGGTATGITRDERVEALRALGSMIDKTEQFLANFSPGSSQHTLLDNRRGALRIAESTILATLNDP